MRTIVSKTEFAALVKRDISTVSHWIADGKISKEALIGPPGRKQKIWYERAKADLALKLDPGQQSAQDNPVALSSVPMPEPALVEASVCASTVLPEREPVPATESEDDDLRRKRRADANRAEHDAEAARRRNAVEEGKWIDAAENAKVRNKELATIFDGFERFLVTTAARDIGDRHGSDWKVEATRMRQLFRDHRSRVSAEAKERREQLKLAPPDDDEK